MTKFSSKALKAAMCSFYLQKADTVKRSHSVMLCLVGITPIL